MEEVVHRFIISETVLSSARVDLQMLKSLLQMGSRPTGEARLSPASLGLGLTLTKMLLIVANTDIPQDKCQIAQPSQTVNIWHCSENI